MSDDGVRTSPPAHRHRPRRGRSGRRAAAVVALFASATALLVQPAQAASESQPEPGRVTIRPSAQVAALIAQLTLTEKLSFVSGGADPNSLGQAGYVPGVPRLGIPELRLTDGPNGIRLNQPATAMPAPVALASTFDDALAHAYGAVLGREGRALRQDVLLSPMTNIIRVPQAGRNFETFSEDPLLSSRMVAAEVRGVQSEGLIATVKHYALNNQETDRTTVDVRVDEQTMREIELPAYQAAVNAGVGAVMCAHNKVAGAHACGNDPLLNRILKEQWGFRGWVMSDWGATHAATDLLAGLDQSMFAVGLQDNPYFSTHLRAAIESGDLPVAALDDAVARILGQMERFGLLDGAATDRPTRDQKGAARVAQRVAETGAVLLKNDGALPLGPKDTTIGVIGTSAKTPKVTGGGSASVVPESAAAPLDTITARARSQADGRARVRYAAGTDATGEAIPASALTPAGPFDADGTAFARPEAPLRYAGTLTVPADGDYTFVLTAETGYSSLTLDGVNAAVSVLGTNRATIRLTAGTHALSLFGLAVQGADTPIGLRWVTPPMQARARAEAVALARTVRTAVVFVADEGTEDKDRATLALPGGQDELVAAVAQANPNTVVVLNTGSSVTMPWLRQVQAVLDMYYPGQNGAQATARLLFGDVNPSGKLTQTFPADESQTTVAGNPAAFPGVDGTETYAEGIHVGYRWYDKEHLTPLFPFGHGLSYTSFAYRDLSMRERRGTVEVTFTVTNTGRRPGSEVSQVYVGASPHATAPQAARKLGGYHKIRLAPGQSQRITIPVDSRQLSYWNAATDRWQLGTGTRRIWVGGSSAVLPLQGEVRITG